MVTPCQAANCLDRDGLIDTDILDWINAQPKDMRDIIWRLVDACRTYYQNRTICQNYCMANAVDPRLIIPGFNQIGVELGEINIQMKVLDDFYGLAQTSDDPFRKNVLNSMASMSETIVSGIKRVSEAYLSLINKKN